MVVSHRWHRETTHLPRGAGSSREGRVDHPSESRQRGDRIHVRDPASGPRRLKTKPILLQEDEWRGDETIRKGALLPISPASEGSRTRSWPAPRFDLLGGEAHRPRRSGERPLSGVFSGFALPSSRET